MWTAEQKEESCLNLLTLAVVISTLQNGNKPLVPCSSEVNKVRKTLKTSNLLDQCQLFFSLRKVERW